jgi:hypothetical protein
VVAYTPRIHSYKPHWAALYTWQHAAPIRHVARSNRCICQQSCAVVHTCSSLQQLASNGFRDWASRAGSVSRKALCPSPLSNTIGHRDVRCNKKFLHALTMRVKLQLSVVIVVLLDPTFFPCRQLFIHPRLSNKALVWILISAMPLLMYTPIYAAVIYIHTLNSPDLYEIYY